jgi:hypothetical protein
MSRRIAIATAVAAALAATTFFVPAASAGNVAWSVSIGGPGIAITAGQPGYWGGAGYRGGYGYGYRPYYGGYYRPWYRPVVRPPIVYAPPLAYAARVVASAAVPAPYGVPAYVAPGRVYVPAPYGSYGY